jgi:hypothetical protein
MQKVDDTQDTASKASFVVSLGLGTTDQVAPFQDSIRVAVKCRVPRQPAATHESIETQDTL